MAFRRINITQETDGSVLNVDGEIIYNGKGLKKLGFVIILLVLFFLISNALVIVRPNEYALIKTFGKVEQVFDTAGPHFKMPFVQSVTYIPKNVQIYDMNPSDVITKDKKSMILDNYALWQINDPLRFYQSLGSISASEGRIDTIVYNSLKNYIGSYDQMDVIASRTNNIDEKLLTQINDSFTDYGITVTSVGVKRFDLPNDNKTAVYNRMISERNQIAASYKAEGEEEAQKIRNETDKQVTIIRSEAEAEAQEIIAQGENEYMKILTEAYETHERKDFYEFLLTIDAMKVAIDGENKTLVLPIDSPITKLFKGFE